MFCKSHLPVLPCSCSWLSERHWQGVLADLRMVTFHVGYPSSFISSSRLSLSCRPPSLSCELTPSVAHLSSPIPALSSVSPSPSCFAQLFPQGFSRAHLVWEPPGPRRPVSGRILPPQPLVTTLPHRASAQAWRRHVPLPRHLYPRPHLCMREPCPGGWEPESRRFPGRQLSHRTVWLCNDSSSREATTGVSTRPAPSCPV